MTKQADEAMNNYQTFKSNKFISKLDKLISKTIILRKKEFFNEI